MVDSKFAIEATEIRKSKKKVESKSDSYLQHLQYFTLCYQLETYSQISFGHCHTCPKTMWTNNITKTQIRA